MLLPAPARGQLDPSRISPAEQPLAGPGAFDSSALLEIVGACLHGSSSEWIFLRELRVGTGLQARAGQRLDAFALNCLAHTSMKRICYEVKIARSDFLCEMKQPLKRRVGMRYSNEFYFVTPAGLLNISEIPVECGLIEIGAFPDEERSLVAGRSAAFAYFDPAHNTCCRVTIPAPWRETPGPTWQFLAGMLRNQQRAFEGRAARPPNQQRLPFFDS
jgi:hypothetical protein